MDQDPNYGAKVRNELLRGRDLARIVGLLSESDPPKPRVVGALAMIMANKLKVTADQQKINAK